MKTGYYYNKARTRGYYLTGEKSGNKWIDLDPDLPTHEWWSLNWMCLPSLNEISELDYFKERQHEYEKSL